MRRKNGSYYLAGAVSLATFIIYLWSLHNEFIEWDDNTYVFENPHIRSLDFSFLKWAFLHFYAGNWHPLTWISHAVDYALWGLNPFGHHLTGIILHAINTLLVVLLAVKLADAAKEAAQGDARAFPDRRAMLVTAGAAGVLFGLHPLHVESVAWVAERKDLLCGLFFPLSILQYVNYVRRGGPLWPPEEGNPQGVVPARREAGQAVLSKPGRQFLRRHYLFALGLFILALLSKPMAVTLPAVLLVLDWYPFGRIRSFRTFRTVFAEKIPFFALSLVSSVLTVLAQKSAGALASVEAIPLSTRLTAVPYSLLAYLREMILPVNLLPFYAYPADISLLSFRYLFALVTVAGIIAACLAIAGKRKLWAAVLGYYVITLLPVIGIVQVGSQAMADRYTYLPSLGPFLVAGLAAAWVYEKVGTVEKWGRFLRPLGVAAALVIVVSLSYLTFEQIGIWQNSIRLWSYAIDREPGVSMSYYNRGYAFFKKGRYDMAMADFDKAIALNPVEYRAYAGRGIVFTRRGRTDRAIADFLKAVELNPSYSRAYMRLGILYGEAGQFGKAIENLGKAIAIDPDDYAAYNDRGFSYFVIRQYGSALRDFNKAIELNRSYALPYFNRGRLFIGTGDKTHAMADFQEACALGNRGGCEALETLRHTTANPAP
jgi:tetratricopeptide (TPR) repeat protein